MNLLTQQRLIVIVLGLMLIVSFITDVTADEKYSFYQGPAPDEQYTLVQHESVRNVIFMIGDGMGLGQISLARNTTLGPTGKLYMDLMPVTGLMRTYAADNAVTDSAASATAMACGIKTNNGMVGMAPDQTPYLTILEAAKDTGMRTGLVVTSAITHATPACFGSHVRSRNNQTRIAEQLLDNKINVLIGGGRQFFVPRSDPRSQRKDNRDLLSEARQKGYTVFEHPAELYNVSGDLVLGVLADDGLTTKLPEPDLAQMTQKAIDLLGRPAYHILGIPVYPGFFLMVEGSQIDWAGHDNDTEECIRQTLLFDQAIKVALDFAVKDRQTLVIVTADHETGGLTLPVGKDKKTFAPKWSTKHHTGIPVPIFAYGPGADEFMGNLDNTDIPQKIAALLGIRHFPRKKPSRIMMKQKRLSKAEP